MNGKRVGPAALFASLVIVLAASAVRAQQSNPLVVVTGVIVDSATATPIRGAFLALGSRGPRAITDDQGRFRLSNVTPGPQAVSIQAFGYHDIEVTLDVAAARGALSFRMNPDPMAIEGIATGTGSTVLSGVVLDASTGEPIPWTPLWLTKDAVNETATVGADQEGIFRFRVIPAGEYLLKAQMVGYQPQFVPVSARGAITPVEIRLEPDPVAKAGLVKVNRELKSRRAAYPSIARAYGPEALNYSASPDAFTFLVNETFITETPCPPRSLDIVCVIGRGGTPTGLRLWLDEIPIMIGADILDSYAPSDFYAIEVFGNSCVRAYTHEFVEKRAKRPRAFFQGC